MIRWLLLGLSGCAAPRLAAPLEALEPLPPCADQAFVLTLLQRVEALTFRPDGTLLVADRGSLTLRDPLTLEVVSEPVPGVNGWHTIDARGGVESRTEVVWRDGELLLRAPRRIDPPAPEVPPDLPALPPEPHPGRAVLPATHRDVLDRQLPLTPAPTAWARDDDTGRWAVATPGALRVFGPDGALLAERPVLPGADSVGLLAGRLFTVADGALHLWDRHGGSAHRVPGTWASAAAVDGALVLMDPVGRLHRYDPVRDQVEPGLCVLGSCAEPVSPPLPPARGTDDLATYGGAVLGWGRALEAWAEAPPPWRPSTVVADGDDVVVVALDVERWSTDRARVARSLHRLDRTLRAVRSERTLDAPTAAPVQAGAGAVILGEQAFAIDDLTPIEPPPLPLGLARRARSRDAAWSLDQVTLGAVTGGDHVPGGLPPRPAPQRRSHTHGLQVDGRYVLGSTWARDAPGGPVQVICPVDATPAPAAPGLLAGSPLFSRAADDRALPEAGRPPKLRTAGLARPAPAEAVDGRAIEWVELGLDAVPAAARGRSEPVIVVTDGPPPADLPPHVRWHTQPGRATLGPVATVWVDGAPIWRGHPSRLPERVETTPRSTPVPDDLVDRWRRAQEASP